MQGLETFPPWAQITLSVIGFIVAAAAYFRGLFKTAPPPSKDVILPSVTVANADVIDRMTETLRETNRLIHERHEVDHAIKYELRRLAEHMMELKQDVRRALERD